MAPFGRLIALALLLAGVGAPAATGDGSPTDPNITFVGRWDTTNAAAYRRRGPAGSG